MKVVILAGGVGSRLAEETEFRPKPMVEIGGAPILWHIMKHYSVYGFDEFIVALGYKGQVIKQFFVNYPYVSGDLTVDLGTGLVKAHGSQAETWTVHLIDTGQDTLTGGRVKRLADLLGEETFFLSWGDGVSNIDLQELLAFHQSHGRLATVVAVHAPARFGRIDMEGDQVVRFAEKPRLEGGWINAGYFVLEPGVLDYIAGDATAWEREPMEGLARDGQLMAYRHTDFWQCLDTLRDKVYLEDLWANGDPPWRLW